MVSSRSGLVDSMAKNDAAIWQAAKPGGPQITATTTRPGLTGVLTYDGRIPQP